MKKAFMSYIVLVLLLVSMLAMVAAVGRTTGGTTNRTAETNPTLNAVTAAACETRAELKDRIACRIEARSSVQSIEESCRAVPLMQQAACNAFHNKARPCYDASPREKFTCLRQQVGFGQGQMNRYAPEDRRKYAALLMYELQERIETQHEQGRLTDEETADLIASVVEIKQALLTNMSIDTIKEDMVAFKVKWRTAIGTAS